MDDKKPFFREPKQYQFPKKLETILINASLHFGGNYVLPTKALNFSNGLDS
jgi:hypothetical protein